MQTVVTDQSSGKYNKRMDIMDHTGEKSNKRSECDYASSQAGTLRTHMKTHTGEKSNKCNHCEYCFLIHLFQVNGTVSNENIVNLE